MATYLINPIVRIDRHTIGFQLDIIYCHCIFAMSVCVYKWMVINGALISKLDHMPE